MKAAVSVFIEQGSERALSLRDPAGIEQHKAVFVHNLGVLLRQTMVDVAGCELLPGEKVQVTYSNGAKKIVDVEMDSCLAIILDVARHV